MPNIFSSLKEIIKYFLDKNHTYKVRTEIHVGPRSGPISGKESLGVTSAEAEIPDLKMPSQGNGSSPTPVPHLDDAMTVDIIKALGEPSDMVTRTLMVGTYQVNMVYIDGMVDTQFISECIVRPLADNAWVHEAASPEDLLNRLDWGGIYSASQKRQTKIDDIVNDILTGSVALIFNQLGMALTFDCKGFDKRPVGPPLEEHTLKGAKDCFVETMRVNTATVRRKICSPDLAFDNYLLGQDTNTMACLVYMRGRVKEEFLLEIKKRLDGIRVEDMLSLSALENSFVDSRFSVFPQILYTEKPDRFCAGILDGRVGLIVDGIPFVMVLPYSFFDFFRMPADYNYKYLPSKFYRVMRHVLFYIALFLPGLFVAVCNFHPEMMPSDLAASIAKARQGVPFPAFFEMTIILVAFHGLIQAGLGSWTSIGGAVSIVGALVLGDAAINARFISPSILVVVAIAGVCIISLQNFELMFATVCWQFLILFAGSFYGLLGIFFAALILLYNLSRMETLGIPYLQVFETYTRRGACGPPLGFRHLLSKFSKHPVHNLRLNPKPPKKSEK